MNAKAITNKLKPCLCLFFNNLINNTMENYNKKAVDFLHKYQLRLNIREAIPQKAPIWVKYQDKKQDYGINYWCLLVNKDGKHYSFDFWGSIRDKEDNTKPRAYDVLACLNTYSDGESYIDFCNNFGYEQDSRTAKETYKAVIKQVAGLKEVLNPEAIAELNEIN